ncbi:hypothetical protein [Nocardiopsis composta]|uniref:Uncharacterized protein n=1 Tax=Nocardiopsis composta TaxID=157465 RepID=A0A7W8QMF1_9ACTN|nr:hypothetical protein [Nocardiopsis composta]MBB5432964.1 hypothetical protein [Nocardiopsis composta]
MTDDVEGATGLDGLDTEELRRRAFARARQRWDVQFFWRIIKSIPAAEAAAGNWEAGPEGVSTASAQVSEALAEHGDPRVQEVLRPVYIEYLTEHGEPTARP